MSSTVSQATLLLGESDLPRMVLSETDLPPPYEAYRMIRDGELDNAELSEHGFEAANAERFARAGRITGFVREFGAPSSWIDVDGADLIVASVAHLFQTPESVHGWMHEVFLADFRNNVGAVVGDGQTLLEVEELDPEGFFDESVGIKAVHDAGGRTISSTVIDFRVGRILGVVYVVTVGNHLRLSESTSVGIAMEKRIVAVALGG